MKFKFTIQPYQTEAVDSVVNVFAGQPFNDRFTYRRDVAEVKRTAESWLQTEEELYMGFANAKVQLTAQQLLENVRKIQARNNIKLSDKLTGNLGGCSLDVEMETGTGKTYVYIKTMFELNKRYGWSKFIVVVPSIAIREGVHKSFGTMQDHFMEHYGKKARFFIYDSKNLAEIDNFSQSSDINVMIINIQAFNARGKDARKIRTELDDFGSRRPIDVIKANRPIVILDEPQKMGGIATQESLKEFNPLFCLNYSATHKQHHNLVYVLDALDAYNKRLVKRIEVKGFDIKNLRGTDSYLFLESIVISPKKPPMARLEFEIGYDKSVNRETRIVGVDDDLYALSKNMEQYRGFRINEVDPIRGIVSFTNGEIIHVGEVTGDVSEADLRRVQIRETIRSHFEKEKELFAKGIKTLSLFFIDEVAKYHKYDEDGNEVNSEYGEIFEQEYTDILDEYLTLFNTPYEQYLRGIEVHQTHAGYFSIDKKGRKVDSSLKRGSDESDDISAYDLILKDKERLLSFSNPVRFIFSHSALREGWDNPNVFQICTLKHGGSSPTQKRQEVGRGLRLCVNQSGDRMDADTLGAQVQQINQLTVIASDGYRDFVADLQRGIREDLYERPTKATKEYFAGKTVVINGNDVTVTEKQANDIYRYLIKNDYIDEDDHVTEKYRADLANGVLAPLPESCAEISEGVHALVQSIFDEHALDGMIHDGRETKIQENALNDNFYKKEFQTLWNYINHKYAYTVEFDSEELIQKAIAHIDKELFVSELRYTVTVGEQEYDLNAEQLKGGTGFVAEHSTTFTLKRTESSSVRYDLIGKIAEGAKLTRKSVARILAGIRLDKFAAFKNNPEEFITRVIRLINEQKANMIVEQITYNQIDGTYDSAIFTAEKNTDFSRAYRAKKNVQDYVFADGYAKDGQSVERKFAEEMDLADEVCVYAKLPKGFSIPTPVGNYSPDWAIAFYKGSVKHIFFIAETKGTMESLNLKPIERAKIQCAKRLFAQLSDCCVVYDVVKTYQDLLNIMQKS
ncbi:restriction endonuclease subunit R [Pseudoflavonifractor sp. 60]|uniref:type III restriction-modification system endonuclease n=1 Tax=Pseudoflavonifractor sp. 60 TaxID=2304576 RepID=UPI00136F4C86|nr:DEAD/DEAH box helicase family protein [Pseudoflavonifractor sp. 60]NBI68111.1 restriction endonuclease subunit R [Pseudoflavonifractor sp. 60]